MKKLSGFTLIELLIVIAIIAILALIAVPNFLEAQTRAKVARVMSDMRSLGTAFATYHMDQGAYPPDFDGGAAGGLLAGEPRGEWKSYRCLTTPVAYMTSVPLDAFAREAANPNKPFAYFQYWGRDAPGWGAARAQKWDRYGIRYFMNSLGPNQQDNALASFDDEVNRVYDPTNGTVSFGDIGMSNTGFFAP